MHVAVSGAAGHLAQAVLPALCADAAVTRVTGFDLRPPAFTHEKFRGVQANLLAPQAASLMREADALVHLAWVVLRGRSGRHRQHKANVEGSRTLLSAAARAGARVVHVSSAAVYGRGRDLPEDAPLAPLAGFGYAADKAEVERWIAAQLPQAVVLRPHIVLGPNALPLLARVARLPCYPRLPDPQPLLQCVHEDDVARAVVAALASEASGPFNLAAPESFAVRDLVRYCRPAARALPAPLLRAAGRLAWVISGWGGEPGWLEALDATLTLDCRRARELLGWQPRYDEWRDIVESITPAPRLRRQAR